MSYYNLALALIFLVNAFLIILLVKFLLKSKAKYKALEEREYSIHDQYEELKKNH